MRDGAAGRGATLKPEPRLPRQGRDDQIGVHGMAIEKDRIDTPRTLVYGSLATVWVVIAVIALQGFFYTAESSLESGRLAKAPSTQGQTVKAEQQSKLVDLRWADKQSGRLIIPIDDAMRVVLDEMTTPVADSTDGKLGR